MKIVILDYATLGYDLDLSGAEKFGTVIKYEKSSPEEAKERLVGSRIVAMSFCEPRSWHNNLSS